VNQQGVTGVIEVEQAIIEGGDATKRSSDAVTK